jgi:hypothetical protein
MNDEFDGNWGGGANSATGRGDEQEIGAVVAVHAYTDKNGLLSYRVVCREGKHFPTYHLNLPISPPFTAEDDRLPWIPTWPPLDRRVPYKLPDLLNAASPLAFYISESEKDIDNLVKQYPGIVATTVLGGSRQPWEPQYNGYFAGKVVRVLLHYDYNGMRFGLNIYREVASVAKKVELILLNGLEIPGDDVSDWLLIHPHADLSEFEGAVKVPPLASAGRSLWPVHSPLGGGDGHLRWGERDRPAHSVDILLGGRG